MSGEKKRNVSASSDMEYQYAEEDAGSESVSEPSQKALPSIKMLAKRMLDQLPKQKKFRFILLLFAVVFVVYKFLNVGMPAADSPKLTAEKIVGQPLTKPAVEASSVVMSAPAIVPSVVKPPAVTVIEPKQLSLDHTKDAVEPANPALNEIQGSLQQLNQSISVIESSLVNLTGSVVRLSDKVKTLETFRQEEKRTLAANPLPVYSLRSLVAGRAWVESPAGDLLTVKVGDFVPGYGQVARIDVRAGSVATTSGRTIGYGPNDS